MSALLNGVVGPSRYGKGTGETIPVRLGPSGEVAELHGKYFEQARSGNLYTWVSGVAGITLLKYDNVAPAFTIWNQSTDKYVVPVKLNVGITHATHVVANVGFSLFNPGYAVATGNSITVFTKTTAYRMSDLSLVDPPAGKVATTCTAVAGTIFIPSGLSIPATACTAGVVLEKHFDGSLILPPGYAFTLCCAVAAQSQAMNVSLVWEEVPIV
jgi:hypothetical protein